ncbi:5-methyltetrahydropteroyltriglutamate--homocysteine S-methyltransferase [Enterococcus dongliensis]|uniref:5-methyltetrahydropteroyltriglutamate-- homocysteine S-methyltransferase n=1 Tax=Enterococcus dongliensis TaxID=2559925 RepID=UPI002890CD9C|nr:5-methyltetrahydropteroyltriglutamate--homocysteine S-methyltransferase [Enterococcus dongliensis]MDT2640590.1 5-methyltetrahydropteroyltriglutamate--homocysteine S-methyltransferase [Enterococcus dongliensis]MDT2669298.1 5-methyltetrahydropteroyltriglutamate--homocysteine S-methyltransferase [Enterococcus dongliensis]MDT2677041.1 5-methyltetrahydropteroyltriglutamate--homocysteine S-methyltransferase [Enterococcus dongliensis]MDT2703538.1 5-methyltetrahydropteroyltriglutamate--homocysteine 
MKTAIIGFPRIGENRELKFATEKYFRNELTIDELEDFSKELRKKHWQLIKNSGVEGIPSNDFSFYDTTLDTACLLNIIPKELTELSLSESEKYFALARGYQGEKGDIKARPMKKWFNTNYHYIVPKFEKDTTISVTGDKIFKEYQEAKNLGIDTRPVIVGPFTLLQLSEFAPEVDRGNIVAELTTAYKEIIQRLSDLGAEWLQIDEPSLVKDVTAAELQEFQAIYQELLADAKIKVLLQTYFGDIRDAYETVIKLPFAGIGLDFIEGRKTVELLKQGFPQDKILFAGVVNGKNIWRNNYQQTVDVLTQINQENLVLTTSCSLLHVPFTTENEDFSNEIKQHFAFAKEKLTELVDLADILAGAEEALKTNQKLFADNRFIENKVVQEKIKALAAEDYVRKPDFEERKELQKDAFDFPILPTTTIGSFPQTREVKLTRAKYKRHEISEEVYDQFIAQQINEWLKWQEEIGLDVLVHGEFERNDMVEYFGQNLSGYLFSKNGWVQSYGTRGVKPPIIWGDVAREKPITVKWSSYAQNQTEKIVKGMLTGPVTILNWSFPREDISLKDSTLQIALAIQEEVLDLEKNGVRVIQIDEAALREKLPLRKTDWYSEYLDWSIPAFRLVHSKVQATTQIHTHMCYSEFTDIIPAIDQMDADVISFEASRSNLAILDELKRQHFKTAVGPGVYDIHSPRIPAVDEIKQTIGKILAKVPLEKVWINPDCGLKTRGIPETTASLTNMTEAVKQIREEL